MLEYIVLEAISTTEISKLININTKLNFVLIGPVSVTRAETYSSVIFCATMQREEIEEIETEIKLKGQK